MLYLHGDFSFNPPLTNYDINADIDTKVEIYHSSYFLLEKFPISGTYSKEVFLKMTNRFVAMSPLFQCVFSILKNLVSVTFILSSPVGSVVKNPPADAGDVRVTGLISGSEKSPG